MINLTHLFKRLTVGIVLASVPLIGGCGDNTLTWTEEVKLLDGRVITVAQKRRYERVYTGQDTGNLPREVWLTFKLPEFVDQDVVWHENMEPRILNLHEGRLYIVGIPLSERVFRQYGSPKPSYIGFRYSAGQWLHIPFNEIPVAIYDTNMLIATEPDKGKTRVSLADKAEEMKDPEYRNSQKRIDPKWNMLNY